MLWNRRRYGFLLDPRVIPWQWLADPQNLDERNRDTLLAIHDSEVVQYGRYGARNGHVSHRNSSDWRHLWKTVVNRQGIGFTKALNYGHFFYFNTVHQMVANPKQVCCYIYIYDSVTITLHQFKKLWFSKSSVEWKFKSNEMTKLIKCSRLHYTEK